MPPQDLPTGEPDVNPATGQPDSADTGDEELDPSKVSLTADLSDLQEPQPPKGVAAKTGPDPGVIDRMSMDPKFQSFDRETQRRLYGRAYAPFRQLSPQAQNRQIDSLHRRYLATKPNEFLEFTKGALKAGGEFAYHTARFAAAVSDPTEASRMFDPNDPLNKQVRPYFEPRSQTQAYGKFGGEIGTTFLIPAGGELGGVTGLSEAAMRALPKQTARAISYAARSKGIIRPLVRGGLRIGAEALDTVPNMALQSYAMNLLQTGDPKQAISAAEWGMLLGGGLALRGPLAEWLKDKSRKVAALALRPQGSKVKGKAEDVLFSGGEDDLVGRRIIIGSYKSQKEVSELQVIQWAKNLNARVAQLDKTTQLKLLPMYNRIFEYMAKKGLAPDGSVLSPQVMKAGFDLIQDLINRVGPMMGEATPGKINKMREILEDEAKMFKTTASGVSVENIDAQVANHDRLLREAAANGLRDIFNKGDVDLGKIQRELHFWKSYDEALGARMNKLVGEEPGETLRERALFHAYRVGVTGMLSAGVGAEESWRRHGSVDPMTMALAGVAGGTSALVLSKLLSSPLMRTTRAVVYNEVGSLIARGQSGMAARILAKDMALRTPDPKIRANLIKAGEKAYQDQVVKTAAYKAAQKQAGIAAHQAQLAQFQQMLQTHFPTGGGAGPGGGPGGPPPPPPSAPPAPATPTPPKTPPAAPSAAAPTPTPAQPPIQASAVRSMQPTPAPTPPPAAPPAPTPAPTTPAPGPSHVADVIYQDLQQKGFKDEGVANVGGMHGGKRFYSDANGNTWLFKEKPPHWGSNVPHAEEAAYRIGRKINPNAVEVRAFTSPQWGEGTLQRFDSSVPLTLSNDVAKLTKSQLEQLQREQVVDWLTGNHDAHKGQFLTNGTDKIVAIDKGQAFKFFGQDKLDPAYHPNAAYGEDFPIYKYLHDAAKDGKIKLSPKVVKDAIAKAQAISEQELQQAVANYAGGATQDLVDKLKQRQANLTKDFANYWKDVPGFKNFGKAAPTKATGAEQVAAGTKATIQQIAKEQGKKAATQAYKQFTGQAEQMAAENIEKFKTGAYVAPHKIELTKHAELTQAEKYAKDHYKGPGETLNHHMRAAAKGEHTLSTADKTTIKHLDSAMEKHTVNQETILYRRVQDKPYHGSMFATDSWAKKVGDIIDNPGYTSTGSSISGNAGFGSTMFVIRVPAGQKGLPYGFADSEKEFLLPRDLKLKIVKKEEVNHTRILHTEIVGHH